MTIGALIDILQMIAAVNGRDLKVFVVDGDGEWNFAVGLTDEALGDPPAKVVYIDATVDPDTVLTEQ